MEKISSPPRVILTTHKNTNSLYKTSQIAVVNTIISRLADTSLLRTPDITDNISIPVTEVWLGMNSASCITDSRYWDNKRSPHDCYLVRHSWHFNVFQVFGKKAAPTLPRSNKSKLVNKYPILVYTGGGIVHVRWQNVTINQVEKCKRPLRTRWD